MPCRTNQASLSGRFAIAFAVSLNPSATIPTMLKPSVRRSACDQCRAKRVRCLRTKDSMAPCARCSYIGTRCVTSASGHPGRPPKQRLADGDSTTRITTASTADISPPAPHHSSTLRDMDHLEDHVPAPAESPRRRPDRHTMGYMLHGNAHPDIAVPNPAVHPHLSRGVLAHEPQPDSCLASGDSSTFFGSPSIDQSSRLGEVAPSPPDPPSYPSQLQGLLSPDEALNAMLQMGGASSFEMDMDPLLNHENGFLSATSQPQCFSAASSLERFREEIDQRIATIDAYYSEPSTVLQRCKDDDDVENPAASLLICSKTFINIIQSLTADGQLHAQTGEVLKTETVLLALSSYLALMRLFDSLFHRIYEYICKVPRESYESIKVKSVLRIGGVSSLQDMPLKAYATGILDAIHVQVQSLERCMGIPAEYCLSVKAASSPTAAGPGIFSRADRVQLFRTVMSQEDVKSRRGSKSYVESIRASIKESMTFLDD